jgi:hypothetical protein
LKLIEATAATGDRSALRCALLREALHQAARVPDPALCLRVAEELAKSLEAPAMPVKVEALRLAQKPVTGGGLAREYLVVAVKLLEQASDADEYTAVLPLLPTVKRMALMTSTSALIKSTNELAAQIENLEKEYLPVRLAQKTLATEPDDKGAQLTVGRWLCFFKGAWDKGLPMLAKGSDDALARSASLEAAAPTAVKEQIALGEAWLTIATTVSSPKVKGVIQRRAYLWYSRAQMEATGLEKIRLEKKLADLVKLHPDLLKDWSHMNLSTVKAAGSILSISQGGVLSTRLGYVGPVEITAVIRSSGDAPALRTFRDGKVLFEWRNKKDQVEMYLPPGPGMGWSTQSRGFGFQPSTWYTFRWRVTEEGLESSVDGQAEVKMTRFQDLSGPPRAFQIDAVGSDLDIRSFEVKPYRP